MVDGPDVFVRVLDEQYKALREEVAGFLTVLRQFAGERGHWLNTPADFESDFDRGLREAKQELREIENEVPLALNPATVHQYLVELAASVRRIKDLDRRSERERMRPPLIGQTARPSPSHRGLLHRNSQSAEARYRSMSCGFA